MIDQKKLLNKFLELVGINGESGNEKQVAEYIKQNLYNLNIPFNEDDAGKSFGGNQGNILGYYSGLNKDVPPILFSSHMDTIEPTKGIEPEIENGKVRTKGNTILGADNRVGVAILLSVIKNIIENKIETGPIYLAFTVAEEIGMFGAKNLKNIDPNLCCGFVFDSSADPGKIITSAPASSKLVFKVLGKSSHAAVQPEKGVNAIKIAAEAISKIETGRVTTTCTINFGVISGGKAINIVPDEVIVEAEARSQSNEELTERIDEIKSVFDSAASKFGGKIELNVFWKYTAFNLDEDSEPVKISKQAIESLGLKPETIVYPGGSDANVFNSNGIMSVNLGVGFKNVHSEKEYMEIKKLTDAANIGLLIAKESIKYLKLRSHAV